jgi:exonuclease SbcC
MFFTPRWVVRLLAGWAVISAGDSVLEPAAGLGAVVDAVLLRFSKLGLEREKAIRLVTCVEKDEANCDFLRKKSLVRLITEFNSVEGNGPLKQVIVITHDAEIFEDSNVNTILKFQNTADGTVVSVS